MIVDTLQVVSVISSITRTDARMQRVSSCILHSVVRGVICTRCDLLLTFERERHTRAIVHNKHMRTYSTVSFCCQNIVSTGLVLSVALRLRSMMHAASVIHPETSAVLSPNSFLQGAPLLLLTR